MADKRIYQCLYLIYGFKRDYGFLYEALEFIQVMKGPTQSSKYISKNPCKSSRGIRDLQGDRCLFEVLQVMKGLVKSSNRIKITRYHLMKAS